MTFEEWCEESQVLYNTIETKADFEYYVKEAWKAGFEQGKKYWITPMSDEDFKNDKYA